MKARLYTQLSSEAAEKICKAEGCDSLYCEGCNYEIPRIGYSSPEQIGHHAYLSVASGGIYCYTCSHCSSCDSELAGRACENPECEKYLLAR